MRFHVPFAHRNQTGRPASLRPVYIGFDEPVSIQNRKRRKRCCSFNWSGFIGLLLALLSPLTVFMLAPIALLFSLNGMRRAPRGMAFVGLVFSAMATTVLSFMILGVAHDRHQQVQRREAAIVMVQNRQQTKETRETMEVVQNELRDYRENHDNRLPSLLDGMQMTVEHKDAWGKDLMYIALEEACLIRSAGPDGEFDTRDDIDVRLDGKPDDWTTNAGALSTIDSGADSDSE